jgi:DNA-binding beta-propeller fold protein YncE
LWISDVDRGAILAIDPETSAVSEALPLGINPGAIAYASDSLWVSSRGDRTVQREPVPGHLLFRSIDGYAGPAAPEPSQLGACSGEDGILTVNIMERDGKANVSPVRNLGDWTCEGGRVWTIEEDVLLARDLTSGDNVQAIPLQDDVPYDPTGRGLAFAQGQLWFTVVLDLGDFSQGGVVPVDPVSGELGEGIPVAGLPAGLVYDGVYLWVVDSYAGTVQAIDPAGHTATAPIWLAIAAGEGIAFDGKRIWVASQQGNSAQYVLVRGGE